MKYHRNPSCELISIRKSVPNSNYLDYGVITCDRLYLHILSL